MGPGIGLLGSGGRLIEGCTCSRGLGGTFSAFVIHPHIRATSELLAKAASASDNFIPAPHRPGRTPLGWNSVCS